MDIKSTVTIDELLSSIDFKYNVTKEFGTMRFAVDSVKLLTTVVESKNYNEITSKIIAIFNLNRDGRTYSSIMNILANYIE